MAESKSERQQKFRLNLVGIEQSDDRPEVSVYAVDQSGKLLAAVRVEREGDFLLPPDALKNAHRIFVGPRAEKPEDVNRDALLTYRPAQFLELVEQGRVLNIPERIWKVWFAFTYCVSGSVSRCFRPIVIRDLIARATAPLPVHLSEQVSAITLKRAAASLVDTAPLRPFERFFPFRCDVICSGTVEVYRRTCCCQPWVIDDLRLPDLVRDLEDLLRPFPVIPDIPFPPGPLPDPLPLDLPFMKEGALDELALNAARDLHAIRTLPKEQIAAYINDRPYLLCRRSCSRPVKMAEGFINPDGRFQICWREPLRLHLRNCHDEYAYVVKQLINGVWMTIYNGLAANIWLHYVD